jgi:hypothetical protein
MVVVRMRSRSEARTPGESSMAQLRSLADGPIRPHVSV